MRKNKILLCVLLAGLLLCGIGIGIMFVDFTGFNYGGAYVYQTDHPHTETIELSLESCPDGPIHVACYMPELFPLSDHFTVDDTMDEGIIKITTTYDSDVVMPSFHIDSYQQEYATDYASTLSLNFYQQYSDYDEFAMFFELKDLIMKDLKNNTLRSYCFKNVLDLTISAAPDTAARLSF